MAKAFALREAPKTITDGGKKGNAAKHKPPKSARSGGGQKPRNLDVSERAGNAERRMTEVVRAQGRMSKKGGKMMSSGTNEFQIASGASLEKLAQAFR